MYEFLERGNIEKFYEEPEVSKLTEVYTSEYKGFDNGFLFFYNMFERVYFVEKIHITFYIVFSLLMCFFATFLILINNPIYSVISLILVYLAASFSLVFIEVHFIAVLFILVYLGAVVVLFLFIVMMLNIKVSAPLSLFTFIPIILLLLVLSAFLSPLDINFKSNMMLTSLNLVDKKISLSEMPLVFLLSSLTTENGFYLPLLDLDYKKANVLSYLLYTHFSVELCIASYVLLLAMVGCIAITLGTEVGGLKKQDTMRQILHSNAFLLKKK